jgi:hypothetical protein
MPRLQEHGRERERSPDRRYWPLGGGVNGISACLRPLARAILVVGAVVTTGLADGEGPRSHGQTLMLGPSRTSAPGSASPPAGRSTADLSSSVPAPATTPPPTVTLEGSPPAADSLRRANPAGAVPTAQQANCAGDEAAPPGDPGQQAVTSVPAPAGTDPSLPAAQQPQAVPIGMTAAGLAGKARANAGQAEPTTRAPAAPVPQAPRAALATPTDDSNAGQQGGAAPSLPSC